MFALLFKLVLGECFSEFADRPALRGLAWVRGRGFVGGDGRGSWVLALPGEGFPQFADRAALGGPAWVRGRGFVSGDGRDGVVLAVPGEAGVPKFVDT